ncbi:IS607 family transposase [Candidatus Poriferisodalis sp.]|uniref:IS607 family transposase n=1 Tax=Candidatus Poriferisodalis sp. TaxID=3101277 RepID=UPI003C6EDBD5
MLAENNPKQRHEISLNTQADRLQRFARGHGWAIDEVVLETASGLNGKRRKLLRVLGQGGRLRLVVEHRDRLARFGFEMVEACVRGSGGEVVVIEPDEIEDDLVRDVTEVLTSMCARLYGKRSAARRAQRALEAAAG